MHSTDTLEDGYLGSGIRISRSIKKYGADQHHREILENLPTREAASEREKELITEEMRADPECLNCGAGGLGVVDRPATTEETRAKISASSHRRWKKELPILQESLQIKLDTYTMSREEVLAALVQPDGKLNKNATRALIKLQTDNLAGQRESIKLAKRERERLAKWSFILSELQNPTFKNELVEQIDAYVYNRTDRPVCKICSAPVTFFRFNQPYATYCGASCQLSDPSQKNPVLSRWAK